MVSLPVINNAINYENIKGKIDNVWDKLFVSENKFCYLGWDTQLVIFLLIFFLLTFCCVMPLRIVEDIELSQWFLVVYVIGLGYINHNTCQCQAKLIYMYLQFP